MKNVYIILVGKPEENRPLGRSRCRGEDIRTDLIKVRWEVVDWIHLAQDRDQWGDFVNFELHTKRVISRLAERLLASQEELMYRASVR
jgi:hypothetical protein